MACFAKANKVVVLPDPAAAVMRINWPTLGSGAGGAVAAIAAAAFVADVDDDEHGAFCASCFSCSVVVGGVVVDGGG